MIAAPPARAQDEVPFVTTPDAVTAAMLELADVSARDHVIDLGSGDGRIVIAAARRGATGLGVEIVPELVEQSRANARAAGVAARVEFREQDLFRTDLARATVVTMYLLPEVNLQLRPRLLALAPGTRLVSHDWDLGDWAPDRSVRIDVPDKALGRDKFSRVHVWVVPAQVHGRWCGGGATLDIVQRFQRFSAAVIGRDGPAPPLVFDGRIAATTLVGEGLQPLVLRLDGETLARVDNVPTSTVAAGTFVRAGGGACR
jgi:SAM-dependent methyltransferase